MRQLQPTVDHHGMANQSATRWFRPPEGFYKCNIDASTPEQGNNVGMGMILRDSSGQFLIAQKIHHEGSFSVKEAEGMALKEVLSRVLTLSLQNVQFETDSKSVVDSLQHDVEDRTEYGAIIKDCRALISLGVNFTVLFIKRQANGVAHQIARAHCNQGSFIVFTDPPQFLEVPLSVDTTCYE